jgi:UDP-glucose:(heptosyl)LPS alpha-1,3-glucosyltransferase
MRLAIIRQRYTPYGGAERFIEQALEALLERNVAISLYTREWPQTNLHLMEPQIVDPFYLGRLWRDWGFARAVCRKIDRTAPDLVQSHERLTCCDIFRAGDGVHAVWLEERQKEATALRRLALAASPYHRYVTRMERRLLQSPSLAAIVCNSAMVRDEIKSRFGVPDAKLHLIYNAVDSDAFSPALRDDRAATRARLGIADESVVFLLVGSGYERKGVATLLDAMRELPPSAHLIVVGRESRMDAYVQRTARAGVADHVTLAGPQKDLSLLRRRRRVRAADALRSIAHAAMKRGLRHAQYQPKSAPRSSVSGPKRIRSRLRDVAALVHMRALMDGVLATVGRLRATRCAIHAAGRRCNWPLQGAAEAARGRAANL